MDHVGIFHIILGYCHPMADKFVFPELVKARVILFLRGLGDSSLLTQIITPIIQEGHLYFTARDLTDLLFNIIYIIG